MSCYIWTCKRGDNVSIHTKKYGNLDFATAVLLKIQLFCDVTVCFCCYTAKTTSQKTSFLKSGCDLWDRFDYLASSNAVILMTEYRILNH